MNLNKKKFIAGLMMIFMLATVIMPSVASAVVGDTCGPARPCGTDEYCDASDECATCPADAASATSPTECTACGHGTWDATTSECVAGGAFNTPTNPFGTNNLTLEQLIQNVLNVVLGFLGFIAVIIILIGGFQWMTAAGDDNKIDKAKSTISAGVIGLVIILAAWAIAGFAVRLVTAS